MDPVPWLPAEALAGAVVGTALVLLVVAKRLPVQASTAVAGTALAALVPYALRREPAMAAAVLGLAAPLTVILSVLGRCYRVGVVGLLLGWSVAAAALATPDTEGPLLLAGIVLVPAAAGLLSGYSGALTRPAMVLASLAWALAMTHGAGGRPSSLVGAVGAWAVMAGLVLGAPLARRRPLVPAALVVGLHLGLAPWVARLVGLRGEWLGPARDVAVVWVSVAVASALVRRAGGHTDHGRTGGHVGRDHGTRAHDDVVADVTAG